MMQYVILLKKCIMEGHVVLYTQCSNISTPQDHLPYPKRISYSLSAVNLFLYTYTSLQFTQRASDQNSKLSEIKNYRYSHKSYAQIKLLSYYAQA
jgi:hypothetical protein